MPKHSSLSYQLDGPPEREDERSNTPRVVEVRVVNGAPPATSGVREVPPSSKRPRTGLLLGTAMACIASVALARMLPHEVQEVLGQFGIALGVAVAVLSVVAARRHAEKAASQESLMASETRHRLVMLATQDVIWDADLTSDTTLWTGAIEEVLGYQNLDTHDEVWFQSHLHPVDRARVLDSLSATMADPEQSSWECEYRFRCREGDHKTLFARGLVLRNSDGVAVRMVGSMMDYTAQKDAEAVLVDARNRAEAAEEAKTRFLANVSHELRTPLTSILGLGELLLDDELEPQQRKFVGTMHRSGQRLLAIIDELLDFSRVEAGFMTVEAQPFDLAALIGQLAGEFAPLATQKQLEFTVDSSDIPSKYMGDELRIAQVLQNLLGNAVKFTKQGFVHLRVARRDKDTGSTLHFIVADSGVGFSGDAQEDLFKSFTQADDSVTREYGGTGLGLAICKQLAELMGGEIKAESTLGKGSVFTLILPVSIPSASASATDHHGVSVQML